MKVLVCAASKHGSTKAEESPRLHGVRGDRPWPKDPMHVGRQSSRHDGHRLADRQAGGAIGGRVGRAVWHARDGGRARLPQQLSDAASRQTLERSFGHNAALNAITGQARRLDTVGGWVSWRMFGLMIIIGAIWGMLTATGLLRKEEDA